MEEPAQRSVLIVDDEPTIAEVVAGIWSAPATGPGSRGTARRRFRQPRSAAPTWSSSTSCSRDWTVCA
jgi:hypothetical protein